MEQLTVTIQFLCRFLDSLEISKMKSGAHSLSIALLLLVNRQESKQETGMVLPQWHIFWSKCFEYVKKSHCVPFTSLGSSNDTVTVAQWWKCLPDSPVLCSNQILRLLLIFVQECICYGFSTFVPQQKTNIMLSSIGNIFGWTATPWVGYLY